MKLIRFRILKLCGWETAYGFLLNFLLIFTVRLRNKQTPGCEVFEYVRFSCVGVLFFYVQFRLLFFLVNRVPQNVRESVTVQVITDCHNIARALIGPAPNILIRGCNITAEVSKSPTNTIYSSAYSLRR